MLEHMKTLSGCNVHLQSFHILISEFLYSATLGANEMVMMLAKMAVLIARWLALKLLLLCKAVLNPAVHALPDEFRIIIVTSIFQKLHHFLKGHMLLCIQKNLNDIEPFLNLPNIIVFNQRSKIRFFIVIVVYHEPTPSDYTRIPRTT